MQRAGVVTYSEGNDGHDNSNWFFRSAVLDGTFSSHARIKSGKFDKKHSPPALFIFPGGDQLACTSSTLMAKNQSTVAQRAETTVPWRTAYYLVSLMRSNKLPGQHSQPTPTSAVVGGGGGGGLFIFGRQNTLLVTTEVGQEQP